MQAIILAAGRGSRLGDHTESTPKCLTRVCGRPLLEWQLDALRSGGADRITIVGGYRAEQLERSGVSLVRNEAWATTNMMSSLLCAREAFDGPAIVSYSDILYGASIVSELFRRNEHVSIVYDRQWRSLWESRFDDPLDDAESFQIDDDRRITEIGRRAASTEEIHGQYVGLMRFSPEAFVWIEEHAGRAERPVAELDMTTLLRGLIEEGRPVHGVPIDGGWCEIDTPRDLELAEKMMREGELILS
jgi:choline kinase